MQAPLSKPGGLSPRAVDTPPLQHDGPSAARGPSEAQLLALLDPARPAREHTAAGAEQRAVAEEATTSEPPRSPPGPPARKTCSKHRKHRAVVQRPPPPRVPEDLRSLSHACARASWADVEARAAAWLGSAEEGRWVRCDDLDRLAEQEAMRFLNTGRDFGVKTPKFYSDILKYLKLHRVPAWTASSNDLSIAWGYLSGAPDLLNTAPTDFYYELWLAEAAEAAAAGRPPPYSPDLLQRVRTQLDNALPMPPPQARRRRPKGAGDGDEEEAVAKEEVEEEEGEEEAPPEMAGEQPAKRRREEQAADAPSLDQLRAAVAEANAGWRARQARLAAGGGWLRTRERPAVEAGVRVALALAAALAAPAPTEGQL